jgi:hypothetical protein
MHSLKTWAPASAGLVASHSRYEALVLREETYNKRHGSRYVIRKPIEVPVYEEGQEYTKAQLSAMADQMLRDDARTEVCTECSKVGEPTGIAEERPQDAYDGAGNQLVVLFDQMCCEDGHTWWAGEGDVKGIGDKHGPAILFEEHFASRRKREIYTTIGTPDPSIVAGMYNRTHPQGRKVNSSEQRKKNGASFYS